MGFTKQIHKKTHSVATQTEPISSNCQVSEGEQRAMPDSSAAALVMTQQFTTWLVTQPRSHAPSTPAASHRFSNIPGTFPIPNSLHLIISSCLSSITSPCLSSVSSSSAQRHPPICCSIAQAPPSFTPIIYHTSVVPISCHPTTYLESSISKHKYYLRSLAIPHSAGLFGIGPGPSFHPNKTRVKPSTIEKAIKRANLEVEAGTQSSLMRVLRARRPYPRVTS